MIKSIELRNWKTHKDTKLDFSKGINILLGQMGSGKSSIMDAISFALFGMFPAIQHKRVSTARLIRNKPTQQKEAQVLLVMDFGGDTYRITRTLSLSSKATATIEKNGAYLQSQPERVTEEVERILKVDYDLFSKAIYSEQNQLDYFMDIAPAARKKQIDGLLGLDKFALAQDNSGAVINRIKDMITDSERMAREFDIKKARAELEELSVQLSKLDLDKNEAQRSIESHTKERIEAEKRLEELKSRNARKVALSREIEGLMARIRMLDSELTQLKAADLPQKDEAERQRKSHAHRLESLKHRADGESEAEKRCNSAVMRLELEIASTSKDIMEKERLEKELAKGERENAQARIAEINGITDRLSAELSASRSAVAEAEKQMKELASHMSKCPVCERELDRQSAERILEGKRRAIDEGRKRALAADEGLAKSRSEAKDLTARLNSMSVIEERLKAHHGEDAKLKALMGELAGAKSEHDAARKSREATEKEVHAATEALQKAGSVMEAIERAERHAKEKSKSASELAVREAEHNSINVDDKSMDSAQAALVKISSELSRHTANLKSITGYIKDKKAQLEAKESEISRIGRLIEDAQRKRTAADSMVKFRAAIADTQSVLRSQLTNSINDIMHDIWAELYPYGDYQGITLDVSDDDYSLKVKTLVDGTYSWESVESVASGGERSTACLAMRIAFSLVLVPNLKWLILDEPTHNIDREGLRKFVQMFSETLPGIVDQVFIITHDDALRQVANARIYTLSRNKAENRETEVAETA